MTPAVKKIIMQGGKLPLDLYIDNTMTLWDYYKRITSYNGPCVRVRRSSDNDENDFKFVNNFIDTQGILNFCGSNNGFATKGYSQVGDNHLVQAGAGNQPRIVNAGVFESNGLYFDGSSYLLQTSSSMTFSAFTIISDIKLALSLASRYITQFHNGDYSRELSILYGYAANTYELFGTVNWDFRTGSGMTIADSNNHKICYSYNDGNFRGYVDGTKQIDIAKAVTIDQSLTGSVGGQEGWSTDCNIKSYMMFNKQLPDAVIKGVA